MLSKVLNNNKYRRRLGVFIEKTEEKVEEKKIRLITKEKDIVGLFNILLDNIDIPELKKLKNNRVIKNTFDALSGDSQYKLSQLDGSKEKIEAMGLKIDTLKK